MIAIIGSPVAELAADGSHQAGGLGVVAPGNAHDGLPQGQHHDHDQGHEHGHGPGHSHGHGHGHSHAPANFNTAFAVGIGLLAALLVAPLASNAQSGDATAGLGARLTALDADPQLATLAAYDARRQRQLQAAAQSNA